jgi:hypothetical protein
MRFILAFLLALLLSSNAFAAITYDTSASVIGSGVTSTSVNHTLGGAPCTSSNSILIIGISWNDSTQTISSVTVAGNAATNIDGVTWDYGQERLEYWTYVGGSGTRSIAVSFSGSVGVFLSVSSYCGVDQITSVGSAVANFGTTEGAASVTVTSATGELVVDMVASTAWSGESLVMTPSGTQRIYSEYNPGGPNNVILASSDSAGAASVTMTWTQTSASNSGPWGQIAVPLKPAPAAAVFHRHNVVMQ